MQSETKVPTIYRNIVLGILFFVIILVLVLWGTQAALNKQLISEQLVKVNNACGAVSVHSERSVCVANTVINQAMKSNDPIFCESPALDADGKTNCETAIYSQLSLKSGVGECNHLTVYFNRQTCRDNYFRVAPTENNNVKLCNQEINQTLRDGCVNNFVVNATPNITDLDCSKILGSSEQKECSLLLKMLPIVRAETDPDKKQMRCSTFKTQVFLDACYR